jgi:bifunctional non-homologous end joining protein LigD
VTRSIRQVEDRAVELSNLEKVLFPRDGLTKGDLVDYYERIGPVMLRQLAGRFVSMHRWPDGLDGEDFYQKSVPDYFPDWIHTGRAEKLQGSVIQVVVDDTATLVYLAQQACVTPHMWLSRASTPRRPDRVVFDFDPSGPWEDSFGDVRWAVRRLRDLLSELGVEAAVMLSGSRGLHVHVAVDGSADFGEAKALSRRVARILAGRYPERLTVEQRKRERKGRIFIDYLRNDYAQTTVAPYAVRALPGAPVAAPIEWSELSRPGMGPRRYTMQSLFRRLGARDDPWTDFGGAVTAVATLRERLDDLFGEEGDGGA